MTRKAIYGMLRAAPLSGALFLAAGAIPVLGAVAALFAPAPILVYAVGTPSVRWRAGGAIALAAILVGLVAGWMAGLAYLLTFGIATAIIVWMLEHHRSFEMITLCTTAALMVVGTATLLLFAGSPAMLLSAMRESLTQLMVHGREVYKTLGIDAGISAQTQSTVIDTVIRLSPALAVVSAATLTLVNLGVFWRISGKTALSYTLFGDLGRWSAPEWLIWVLIATGFALFIPQAAIHTIALDSFLCVASIYFCQGLAILAFYFKRHKMPAAVRGIVYFLAGVQPVVAALVASAGVFDMWVDFRRLKPPKEEAGSFGDFL